MFFLFSLQPSQKNRRKGSSWCLACVCSTVSPSYYFPVPLFLKWFILVSWIWPKTRVIIPCSPFLSAKAKEKKTSKTALWCLALSWQDLLSSLSPVSSTLNSYQRSTDHMWISDWKKRSERLMFCSPLRSPHKRWRQKPKMVPVSLAVLTVLSSSCFLFPLLDKQKSPILTFSKKSFTTLLCGLLRASLKLKQATQAVHGFLPFPPT